MKRTALTLFAFTGLSLVAWVLSLSSCARKNYNVIFKNVVFDGYRMERTTKDTFIKLNDDSITTFNKFKMVLDVPLQCILAKQNTMSSFVNSAMAYKPAPAIYNFLEKVTTVKVFTVKAYNAQFPEGSDITSICKYTVLGSGTLTNMNLMPRAINMEMQPGFEKGQDRKFILTLSQAPDNTANKKQFRIEIMTERGSLLADTTRQFYIQ